MIVAEAPWQRCDGSASRAAAALWPLMQAEPRRLTLRPRLCFWMRTSACTTWWYLRNANLPRACFWMRTSAVTSSPYVRPVAANPEPRRRRCASRWREGSSIESALALGLILRLTTRSAHDRIALSSACTSLKLADDAPTERPVELLEALACFSPEEAPRFLVDDSGDE